MENKDEIVQVEVMDLSVVEAQDRALFDKQIATAKQFPRNVIKVKENIQVIASMDEETAKACGYSLPRGGKNISGPSVHLARIVAQQYGNIRIDAKITDIDRTHVTGQATCIDLENNVGIRVEVKRKITNSTGQRYNDDMITVTGNAAASIALRNAVYNVVPKPLIDAGYRAAQEKIIGDVSDENKLLAKRKQVLEAMIKSYGITEKDILRVLGLRETTQIKAEEIKQLIGLGQAIKDGDTTIDEAFFPDKASKEASSTAAEGQLKTVLEKDKKPDSKAADKLV